MATPHEFTIPIASLDAGGKEFRFPLRAPWLRSALEESGAGVGDADRDGHRDAGEVTLRASRSGNDVVLHGRLTATLFTDCARCTGPARVLIDEPLTTLAVPATALAPVRSASSNPRHEDRPNVGGASGTPKPRVLPDGVTPTTKDGAASGGASSRGPGGRSDRRGATDAKTGAARAKGPRGREGADAEYEFTAEEADTLTYEGDTVVLDDFIRDELLLEIPMIPLCSEDCAGIHPAPVPREPDSSGKHGRAELSGDGNRDGNGDEREIDIDPRLAPLLDLKKKLGSQ